MILRSAAGLLLGLAMLLQTSCAVRYPPVVAMREQQFRSHDEPVALPLSPQARQELETFLARGGNRFGRNPVPGAIGTTHRQLLDALTAETSLNIRAGLAVSNFCAIAAPLCQAAPALRHRRAVTQVVDARNRAPEVPDPIAVCEDGYCWIFRQASNRFTSVVVLRDVQRPRP